MPPRRTKTERPANYHPPSERLKARLLTFARAAARRCNDQGHGINEFTLAAFIDQYRLWIDTEQEIDEVFFRLYLEEMRESVKHLGSDVYAIL